MRLIIIFFIVVLAITVLFNLGQSLKGDLQEETVSQSQENAPQEQYLEGRVFSESSGLAAIVPPSLINTYITAGPEEGKAIEGTNIVTFEFEAEFSSKESEGWMFFETKVEGLDDDWKRTSSPERTIILPLGQTEYTFLVRAKTSNSTDPTPAKRTFKVNLSPYFRKVKISNVRVPYSSYPSVITLRTSLNKEEEINITGWQVEGKRGKTTIPQGIERYFPSLSPKDNIIIKKDDIVYLSSGQGPLGKKRSFRSNKCFGYLTESGDSSLSLPKSCPKPRKEDIFHLNPCCQEFILQIRGCEVPDYSRNFRIYQDPECVSYLEKNFNYSGCFRNYVGDENFLWNSWYIFLNFDVATGDFCDTVYLRDQNGLFVDKHSYGQDVCR